MWILFFPAYSTRCSVAYVLVYTLSRMIYLHIQSRQRGLITWCSACENSLLANRAIHWEGRVRSAWLRPKWISETCQKTYHCLTAFVVFVPYPIQRDARQDFQLILSPDVVKREENLGDKSSALNGRQRLSPLQSRRQSNSPSATKATPTSLPQKPYVPPTPSCPPKRNTPSS